MFDSMDNRTTVAVESTNPQEATKDAIDVIKVWLGRGWTIENVLIIDRTVHSLVMEFAATEKEPIRVLTVVGCMNFGDDSEMTAATLQIIQTATHNIQSWMERVHQQVTTPSDALTLRVTLTPEW